MSQYSKVPSVYTNLSPPIPVIIGTLQLPIYCNAEGNAEGNAKSKPYSRRAALKAGESSGEDEDNESSDDEELLAAAHAAIRSRNAGSSTNVMDVMVDLCSSSDDSSSKK